MKKFFALLALVVCTATLFAQEEESVDKVRTLSGIDPTRVTTQASFSTIYYDKKDGIAQINNRLAVNLSINQCSFQLKSDIVTTNNFPDGILRTGFGDLKFTFLNAFYVKGKNALAAAVEFGLPTTSSSISQGTGIGGYFVATPSITWSYTITPGFMFALQPQYAFALVKNRDYPDLNVLTMRMFVAKFFEAGYFVVLEPRPVYDFSSDNFDLIISPIFGKTLGKGYNLILISEIPTKSASYKSYGLVIQVGVSKNF